MGTKPKQSRTQRFLLIIGVIVAIVAGLNTQIKATTPEEPQKVVEFETLDAWMQKLKSTPKVLVEAVFP